MLLQVYVIYMITSIPVIIKLIDRGGPAKRGGPVIRYISAAVLMDYCVN